MFRSLKKLIFCNFWPNMACHTSKKSCGQCKSPCAIISGALLVKNSKIRRFRPKNVLGRTYRDRVSMRFGQHLNPCSEFFFSCSRGPILTPGVPNSSSFKSRWQIPNLRHLRHHQRVENPGGIPTSACHKLEMDLAWSTGYFVLESDPIWSSSPIYTTYSVTHS